MEESECQMETYNMVAETEREDEFIVLDEIEFPVAGVEPAVNKATVNQCPKLETLLTRMTLEEKTNMEVVQNTAETPSTSLFEVSECGIPEPLTISDWGKRETLFKAAETGDPIPFLSFKSQMLIHDEEIDFHKTPLRNDCGDSLIHVAVKAGQSRLVPMLLFSFKEDINCQGYRMRTPLHCAIGNGDLGLAKGLLVYGAKVDTEDADGVTPLGLAASMGYRDFVEILLKRGARPEEMELYLAAKNGRWDIVELMLEPKEMFCPLWRRKEKDPLVVLACRAHQWGMVKRLLEKGASASDCQRDSDSALVWAAACGQADVVQLLLRYGAASQYGQMQWALMAAKTAEVVRVLEPNLI